MYTSNREMLELISYSNPCADHCLEPDACAELLGVDDYNYYRSIDAASVMTYGRVERVDADDSALPMDAWRVVVREVCGSTGMTLGVYERDYNWARWLPGEAIQDLAENLLRCEMIRRDV